MKKILLFVLCTLFTTSVLGQENENLMAVLKQTYTVVFYSDGYYHVCRGYGSDNQGLCDDTGKEIVPCRYDYIGTGDLKKYGIACVHKSNKKKGIIDIHGKEIFDCSYDEVYIRETGHIDLKKNGKASLHDFQGNVVIPQNYNEIYSSDLAQYGYCHVKKGDKYGVYHVKLKKELIPCRFEYISIKDLKEKGYCRLKENGKYGCWSVEGKEIIPCRFSYISDLSPITNCFEVTSESKVGLWSKEGKEIIPCKFRLISDSYFKKSDCYEVMQTIGNNVRYGAYRKDGKEIVPCNYESIHFNADYLEVVSNGKRGLFSIKDAKVLMKCNYYFLGKPSEGLVWYQETKDSKVGYMDFSQNIVIAPEYDIASDFKDGVAQVTKNDVVSLIKNPLTGTNLDILSGNELWVDTDIPLTEMQNYNTFAFIFANEIYTNLSKSDYSQNDGKVFMEYCNKSLGIPTNNIRFYEDATYGNMANALKQLKDIADVYDGEAKIIFYFSGLGITDESNKERYILPSDASLSAVNTTCYKVADLMNVLNIAKTQYTFLIIDAPFNGMDRGGNSLSRGRGVAISYKNIMPQGNIIAMIGSENGTCHASKQLQHGLMTFCILNKLKETKGNCSIDELMNDVIQKTKEESLKQFKDVQSTNKVLNDKQKIIIKNVKL